MAELIKLAFQNEEASIPTNTLVHDSKVFFATLRTSIAQIFTQFYISPQQNSSQGFTTTLFVNLPQVKHHLAINVTLSTPSLTLSLSAFALDRNQLLALSTRNLRLNFLWFLHEVHKREDLFTGSIDQENGMITLKSKCPLHAQILNNKMLPRILQDQIKSCIHIQLKLIKVLRYFSQTAPESSRFSSQTDKLTHKIRKFLSVSFLELGVSHEDGDKPPTIIDSQKKQRELFQKKKKFSNLSLELSTVQQLFSFKDDEEQVADTEDGKVCLSEQEISEMEGCLKFPKPKVENPNQNEFIFNKIVIRNPEKIAYSPLSLSGGTANLKLAKIVFNYKEQCGNHKQNQRGEATKLIEKVVLIKTPKTQDLKKYIQHQKNIVSSFKFSCSAYMPKYYSTDSKPLKNQLIIDFYPRASSLKKYLTINSKTLEVKTKILLMANIANGLRFLKKNSVVHLDLNVNNILVGQNLFPKLIDFGESYSYDRSQEDEEHQPGFTNPFGPPEIFTQKQFGCKQDIFSFGIILFFVLFGKLPFEPTDNLVKHFKKKTYCEKFYLAVESAEWVWHGEAMMILCSLISRMIDPDQLERPYPTWARAILKYMQIWEQKLYAHI